jgi:glycine betaine/proline transport system substrate-binding protein
MSSFNSIRAGRLGLLVALALSAIMLTAACAGDNGEREQPPADDLTPEVPSPTPDPEITPERGVINIAFIPGWPDAVSTSNLWKVLLEEQGYEVELTGLEVAATFVGLSRGDVDLYLSSWLPNTHEAYWEEFGDELEQLSVWYQPAGLYLTVPSYVDEVDTLGDLSEHPELFDERIVGIEPGAGMMGILRDRVMPEYGVDDWELVESSTPAMLAELERAIENQDPIVVTLWSPGWWYGEWDLKNLEDPQNAWGDADQLTVVARQGFDEDFPKVTEWLQSWEMSDEEYAPLEALIDEMGDGNEEEAVRAWLEDNRDVVQEWIDSAPAASRR